MFSKRGSVVLTKGKPLRARQPSVEVKASSTREFMRADKFEKSEQGGSRALNFIYCAAAVQGFRTLIQVRGGLFVYVYIVSVVIVLIVVQLMYSGTSKCVCFR